MDKVKVFYLVNDNGEIADILVGDENTKETALNTLAYIEKTNDSWIRYRIAELEPDGTIHRGKTNILTTIKLNGIPCRAIMNTFYNVIEIIESYMNIEDEYKRYTYDTTYINL